MKKLIFTLVIILLSQIIWAGGDPGSKSLIVYGSFQGSTKEIAEKMKTVLESKHVSTDIIPAENKVLDLSKYRLVILGSAIHGAAPHPAILQFVKANADSLKKKKTAVFIVCITITSSKANLREAALHYPEKVAIGFKPESTAVFAGVARDSGWFGNWVGKMVLGIQPGDFRDWKKIGDWTSSLPLLIR